ncbi:MAG: hypothetical protein EXQ96_10975 [Alphaproteobacteria bacterium]|nr:hypothetical protein [Alphaproteobacteria bacterium]
MQTAPISERAARLRADALVWDGCISWISMEMTGASRAFKVAALPRYVAAGCNVVSLTVSGDFGVDPVRNTVHWLASERRFLKETHPDLCLLVDTAEDIIRAKREGKLAVTFHFQGCMPFYGSRKEDPIDTNLVQLYYDLGVRQALLAHNLRNMVADGCKERGDGGLSEFGIRLVQEMNRVGMVVDCTHTGYCSTMEAMELTTKPAVFSHSNCRAIFDHPRNIRDDQIAACARTGGVACVTGWGPIVNPENVSSVDAVMRHIDHMVNLVGAAHVGIGLDFVYDGSHTTERVKAQPHVYAPGRTSRELNYDVALMDFMQPEALPLLTDAMLERGYAEGDVRGILGESLYRVMRANWAA